MISITEKKCGEYGSFVLSDGKSDLAECIYSFENAEIIGLSLSEGEELNFKEAVLRAALSKLDFAGKTKVICNKKELYGYLVQLGFEDEDGTLTVDTTGFFKPCCGEKSK